MENKIILDIYCKHEDISRKEIDDMFSTGDIPHQVALKMISNRFDDEALEGFQKMQYNTLIMNALDAKIATHFRSSNFRNFDVLFSILWSLGIVCIVIFSLMFNHELKKEVVIVIHDHSTDTETAQNTKVERFKVQDIVPVADQIQPSEKSTNKEHPSSNLTEREIYEFLRMQENVLPGLSLETGKAHIRYPKAKEVALRNFIFIDYRSIRSKLIEPSSPNLTGVAANIENEHIADHVLIDLDLSTEIAYHKYLEETAELMNKGHFDQSINRFEIILKQFPDDHNALFYVAFCKFQIQKYGESLNYLHQLKHPIWGNFEEETQWYIAKCYFELNQHHEFLKIANEIIRKNGFYATQAKALIKGKL